MKPSDSRSKPPAEDSIFLRLLWFAQVMTCLTLVVMVDPNFASIGFGEIKIPLVALDIWIAVSGCSLTWIWRNRPQISLLFIGLFFIATVMWWYTNALYQQWISSYYIDVLLPTLHLLAGLLVAHSFELRTRKDFNFSLALSLLVVSLASSLGKGWLFGGLLLVYLAESCVLLLLDCESMTFGSVCPRGPDPPELKCIRRDPGTGATANLLFPMLALVCLTVTFFMLAPRAESLADEISSSFYALFRERQPTSNEIIDRLDLANPLRPPKPASGDEIAPLRSRRRADGRESEIRNRAGNRTARNEKGSQHGNGGGGNQSNKGKTGRDASASSRHQAGSGKEESNTGLPEDASAGQAPSMKMAPGAGSREGQGQASGEASGSEFSDTANARKDQGNNSTSAEDGGASDGGDKPHRDGTTGQRTDQQAGASDSGINPDPDKIRRGEAVETSPGREESQDNPAGSGRGSANKGKEPRGADPEPVAESLVVREEGDDPERMDTHLPPPTSEKVVLSVECNRTVFFRQSVFDYFDGHVWRSSHPEVRAHLVKEAEVSQIPANAPSFLLPREARAVRLGQSYRAEANLGHSLIFAGFPETIFSPSSDLCIDASGNITSSLPLKRGAQYTVVSMLPLYDLAKLRYEPPPPPKLLKRLRSGLHNFLTLPKSHSPEVRKLAEKLSGEGNWFARAERIMLYLRKNYKGGELSPTAGNTVNHFLLSSRRGNCKDFSSSFVLMCRSVGIPARLVTGYASGDFDPATGMQVVRAKHGHCWAEVYIPGSSWIPFDATPQGTLPERAPETEQYFSSLKEDLRRAIKGSENTEAPSAAPGADVRATTTAPAPPSILSIGQSGLSYLPMVLLLVMPLVLLVLALRRSGFSPVEPEKRFYLSLLKELRRLGVETRSSDTPEDVLRRTKSRWQTPPKEHLASGKLIQEMTLFMDIYNRVHYGGKEECGELRSRYKDLNRQLRLMAGQQRHNRSAPGPWSGRG